MAGKAGKVLPDAAAKAGAEARPRRRRKDARPQELTAAALALFVEKGFAATRLDEIAARAGVSKGTLYLYFDSKEALFKAAIEEGVLPAIEAGEALLDEYGDDPVGLVRGFLRAWWEQIGSTAYGGIPKLMFAEAANFPEVARYYNEAVIQRGVALLRTAVARGIASGVFRPVELSVISPLLISPLIHLATWRNSIAPLCGAGVDPDCYLETHIDLVLHGLCAGKKPDGEPR